MATPSARSGDSHGSQEPLRNNNDDDNTSDSEVLVAHGGAAGAGGGVQSMLIQVAVDVVASIGFWYVLLFVYIPDSYFYMFLAVLATAMVGWRVYQAYAAPKECGEEVPYTCGYVNNSGKELFLVATIHISPRAPKDVEAVIDTTRPDVTMIELDDERLDRMRDPEPDAAPPEPRPEDLQPIRITKPGSNDTTTVRAQRALWNAEWADSVIRGDVVYDAADEFGMKGSCGRFDEGSLVLVRRGGANGEFAPYALKAHLAYKRGAEAILVINTPGALPVNRVGGGSVTGDLKVAMSTWSCGFPPVPLLLLPHAEGEKLKESCLQAGGTVSAEFQVLPDTYPRRTLRRRLCQACALMFSGIGILYGVIQCFAVEVGGEFLAAEIAATKRNIPCTCIDVDLNRFWSRLGLTVLPTPCNLLNSLWSWIAFPRVFFRVLFPPPGNVDVIGSMFLHGASFPLKTWVAFIIAGFCASTVTNKILELFGYAAEQGAEQTGAVSKEDRDVAQAYIMLLIEMYMLPQIYDAVAASRDEAMYQSMVKKGRTYGARKMVVVVGAGHANGILQRARAQGL
mmetsp:Transcript_137862/g.344136  ORF Transcript_137862/g.344136 Transcript_137862/m.344136 type:complete len:567 (-) Transcript_137862:305-2005(-)